jgi:hypothetical protein
VEDHDQALDMANEHQPRDKIVNRTIIAFMKSHEDDTLISLVLQTNA